MNNIKITDMRVTPGDSAFLIDDGKTAILYDSGFAFTGYAVADKIKAYLGSRELDYIFLTHSHYDHALGSVYALKYWPGAKVVAGEYAVKIFSKPTAKALMRELDRKFANKNAVGEYEDLIDNLRVDIPVCDGSDFHGCHCELSKKRNLDLPVFSDLVCAGVCVAGVHCVPEYSDQPFSCDRSRGGF